MKTSVTAVFGILACAGAWAQDSLDGEGTDPAAEAPPPPPAGRSIDLQATSLSVTLTAWNELLDDLQPFNSKHVDESMPVFVGDSAEIRVWISQQLQSHRAILDFDTRGRATNGQTWSFKSESNNRSITIPKPDGAGVVTGMITAPKFEITAWMSASEAANISVQYRPAGFQADTSEAHGSESAEPDFVGIAFSPHTAGRSFVYWINRSREPVSLLVVSVSNANGSASDADEHDPVSISSNWPVPYTTTVPRSAAPSLPFLAEVVPGNDVDRESAPPVALPEPAAGSPADGYRPPPQPDVSTAGDYIQLTSGEARTIEMHEHEARRVELDRRIASASGFNPDIVEVVSSGTDGLHIQSSRSGATKIRIVDEDGVPLELTVIVTCDLTDLELLLERLYPETDVEVIPIRDTVLLRGTVDDPEQVAQIEEIAEQFAPRVLNQLRVVGTEASSTGSAVSRDTASIRPGQRIVTLRVYPGTTNLREIQPGDHVNIGIVFPTAAGRVKQTILIDGAPVFSLQEDGQVSLVLSQHWLHWLQRAGEHGEFVLTKCPNDYKHGASFNVPEFELLESSIAERSHLEVVEVIIGPSPAEVTWASIGELVDVFTVAPGVGEKTLAEGVRQVGFAPDDDQSRSVWVAVSPEVAEHITQLKATANVSFSVQLSSVQSDSDLHSSESAQSRSIPTELSAEQSPRSDFQALRDDILALHEDVRRLIEVLEDRQLNETNANASPATPAIDEGAAMLFFNASWCGPCQRMRPIVSRLRNDGFAIRIVDVEEEQELSRKYEIRSIPCCVFLYDGREVERVIGMTTENELRNRLARASSPEYRSETESLGRVWTELGLQIEEATPDDERLSNSHYRGAVQITRVRAGSPAAAAGLRPGDLLVGLHVWETISRENVEYVLDRNSSNSFSPLMFYVLRDGETLSGRFPHGEGASLEYPRQINHSVDTGTVPIAATSAEAVDLLPLPAGPAQPETEPGE